MIIAPIKTNNNNPFLFDLLNKELNTLPNKKIDMQIIPPRPIAKTAAIKPNILNSNSLACNLLSKLCHLNTIGDIDSIKNTDTEFLLVSRNKSSAPLFRIWKIRNIAMPIAAYIILFTE